MRFWSGREDDEGSVHCLGNGKMCVYEKGPDVTQVFGPPYSSPSILMILFGDESLEVESIKVSRSAIWEHTIKYDNEQKGEMTDFVDSEVACFVRKINTTTPLKLIAEVTSNVIITDNSKQFSDSSFSGGFLIYSMAGRYIYNDYPLPNKTYFQVLLSGDISFNINNNGTVDLDFGKGESVIYVIGGIDYREVCMNMDSVIGESYNSMLARTEVWWKAFSAKRHDFESLILKAAPMRSELLDAIDSVASLIKTQQGSEGGVLAGHNYHMGYVRDQYGVFRCLLKLGYIKEAKKIISFYWDVWKQSGKICNAQCMGVPGIFHIHENDEVEITGYLIIQAFNYLKATGDDDFMFEIYPMLEWAYEAQKNQLASGMLPFNGDETYVAGGILPRSCINDGSAEATMLFVTSGEKLINWLAAHSIRDNKWLTVNKSIVSKVKDQYRKNFFQDGKLVTNNPLRKEYAELPKFRHGVCEGCMESSKSNKHFSFGWTERSENNRYLCPDCKVNNNLGKADDIVYFLQSVSLMPLYIESDLLTREEILHLIEPIIEQYKKTGKLPSRPDGNITVGYDYGLLLYTLTELEHPLAEEIYHSMMSAIDSTGAWVEYYVSGKPSHTRCRPWESGINLEAAIHFMQKKYGRN